MIHFAHKVWHRMFAHSHEIVIALLVEAGKGPVVFMLLLIAAICLMFAAQVAFGIVEE